MKLYRQSFKSFIGVSVLAVALTGCMGWLDIFEEQRPTSGDYSLMIGEDARNSVYLMQKGSSTSVTGPLHEIGWSQQFILFTDDNWPTRWNVIDTLAHKKFTITESQRGTDLRYKEIKIVSPADAWTVAKLQRH